MYTSQIDALMAPMPGFVGVFAANEFPACIPPGQEEPFSLIINNDPSWKPGRHWLAIAVCPRYGKVIYFDSTARPPEQVLGPAGYARLQQLCTPHRRLEFSPFPVQTTPTLEDVILGRGDCGEFCIYILRHLPALNYNLTQLVYTHFLPSNPTFNQNRVRRYISQIQAR